MISQAKFQNWRLYQDAATLVQSTQMHWAGQSEPIPSLLPQALDGVDQTRTEEKTLERPWKTIASSFQHCLMSDRQNLGRKTFTEVRKQPLRPLRPGMEIRTPRASIPSASSQCSLPTCWGCWWNLDTQPQKGSPQTALRSSRNSWVGVVTIKTSFGPSRGKGLSQNHYTALPFLQKLNSKGRECLQEGKEAAFWKWDIKSLEGVWDQLGPSNDWSNPPNLNSYHLLS